MSLANKPRKQTAVSSSSRTRHNCFCLLQPPRRPPTKRKQGCMLLRRDVVVVDHRSSWEACSQNAPAICPLLHTAACVVGRLERSGNRIFSTSSHISCAHRPIGFCPSSCGKHCCVRQVVLWGMLLRLLDRVSSSKNLECLHAPHCLAHRRRFGAHGREAEQRPRCHRTTRRCRNEVVEEQLHSSDVRCLSIPWRPLPGETFEPIRPEIFLSCF